MGKSLTTHRQTKSFTFTNKKWPGGQAKLRTACTTDKLELKLFLALQIDENIIWFWKLLEKEVY